MNAHAAARDRWLANALGVLATVDEVAAVELVGSLGRGEGDEWSDVDLLVFVDGDVRTALDTVLPQLGEVAVTDERRRVFELMMTVIEVKRFARGATDVAIDDLCIRAARAPEDLAVALARMIDLASGPT